MAITVNQSTDMPAGFVRLGRSNAENLDAATLEIGIATVDAGKGGKHLDPSMEGAAAWASGETWFAPESSAAESQMLVLELGPRVTWHLKPNHPYWVHLRDGKGQRARDRMIWRAVRLPTSPPEPAVQPKPAEPSPPPDIAPVPESDAAPADAPTEVAATAAAAPSEAEDTAVAKEQKRNARNIFSIAAGLMGIYHWIGAAVAIVVLAFFLQYHRDNIQQFFDSSEGILKEINCILDKVLRRDAGGECGVGPEEPPEDEPPEEKSPEEKPPVTPPAPPITTIEKAREILKENRPADRLLEEAKRSEEAGARVVADMLLKQAAKGGSAEAARKMGQRYDPVTYTPGGMIRNANAEEAAEWYEKAAKAGDVDAMLRLAEMYGEGMLDRPDAAEQRLHWLRKAADAGSETAKERLQ